MSEGRWAGGWGAQRVVLYVREQEKRQAPGRATRPNPAAKYMKYNHDVITNQKL